MKEHTIIADAAEKVFRDLLTPAVRENALNGIWPESVWQQLESVGLVGAAVSEKRGGPGLTLSDCCALAKAAGRHAAPVPLVESFLAERMLDAADLPPATGIVGIAPPSRHWGLTVSRNNGRIHVSGKVNRITWGRRLTSLVAIADDNGKPATVLLSGPFKVTTSENVAGEPSDSIEFDQHVLSDMQIGPAGKGLTSTSLRTAGALYRCAQMVGAMQVLLEMTTQYAKQREQFGRPIAKFQAVQQQIAVMGSESVASDCVVSAAIEAAGSGAATFEIAAAKSRLGKAADIAIDVAHQVHGAMGTTREFPLHHFTMRLALWRDEFGSPGEWSDWIGTQVCAKGGAGLWPYLTAVTR